MSNTRDTKATQALAFHSIFDTNNICSHDNWQVTVFSYESGNTYLAVEGVTKSNQPFRKRYNLVLHSEYKELNEDSLEKIKSEYKFISFQTSHDEITKLFKILDEYQISFTQKKSFHKAKSEAEYEMTHSSFFSDRKYDKSYAFVHDILCETNEKYGEDLPKGRHSFMLLAKSKGETTLQDNLSGNESAQQTESHKP